MPKPWEDYASDPEARYQLQRKGQRCRWWDRLFDCQVGPEQSNVAPALAWAMHVRLEQTGTVS